MKLKHLFILSLAAVPGGALAADPQVDIKTNVGTIRLELYPAKAPKTVENFLQYVKDGHYNGTVFHRVIDGFMVQGWGYKGCGKVVDGMDVVTKIGKTPTGSGGPFRSDVPKQPVVIESVTVVGTKK